MINNMLENKNALVCGSTDGIGKETAILLAQKGAEIILLARNKEKLISTISELSINNGQNHRYVCADFDNPLGLKEAVQDQVLDYEKPIHILINNSGGPHGGPLIEAEENEFRIAFERLLICNHILAKEVVPRMKEIKYGRIINIISTSVKQVIKGLGVSNTVRGSVAQWAKTLALELGEFGITVNNILPGYTKTNRLNELALKNANFEGKTVEDIFNSWASNNSINRIGDAKEIAESVAFLASESSGFINGHDLVVDGGRFR
tara:strand:- start:379 stop:1167 length:789 start_codon:yes stop_codon:yes gene_type:complete